MKMLTRYIHVSYDRSFSDEAAQFGQLCGRGHPGRLSSASLCHKTYEPHDLACEHWFSNYKTGVLIATLHGYRRVSDDECHCDCCDMKSFSKIYLINTVPKTPSDK